MESGLLEMVYSELYVDEELPADFDRLRRDEPPWFGFVPRVLALDLTRPFRPVYALWKDGDVCETGKFSVDRRRVPGYHRAVILLTDCFADLCRERGLFGAYFVLGPDGDDPARNAAAAALVREADWCGMFVLEAAPSAAEEPVLAASVLAQATAARLTAGEVALPSQIARRQGYYAARLFTAPLGIDRCKAAQLPSPTARKPIG